MRRIASLCITAAAWLVPGDARAEWRAEWTAELHARRSGTAALNFALGAFMHAAWLQKERWRPDMVSADIRYGWRQLRARPGVSLAAALTLAIGIGASTAIFSAVYGVLLKPLPYRAPERLVQLWETNPRFNWTEANIAPGNMISWKERNRSLESMAWYMGSGDRGGGTSVLSLSGAGEPVRVDAQSVSPNFFEVLGSAPMVGRAFVPEEGIAGKHRVAVLSHAFWQRQFASDPSIVNRKIALNGRDFVVVGVMPKTFAFDNAHSDIWVPFVLDLAQMREVRRPHFLRVVARLKDGVSIDQARADITAIAKDLEREYPATNTTMGAGLGPLTDWFVGPARSPLLAFLAAVGIVLLIACVNVTNLFLTRNTERGREMHLRSALGANRLRLLRQLLAEAGIVAGVGAALGMALAAAGLRLFIKFAPAGIPRIDEVGINVPVALFAIAVTAVTTMLVGMMPAWQASRVDLRTGMGDGARMVSTAGKGLRRVLVGAEVALAIVLLVGASMTLRSFVSRTTSPVGFTVDGLVSAHVSLPGIRYGDDGKSAAFFEELTRRLREQGGVTAAGAVSVLPLAGQGWTGQMYVEGRPDIRANEVRHKTITDGYLEALGVPLLQGRFMTAADTQSTMPVVVNAALARQYFPAGDAVGRRIAYDAPSDKTKWRTIVGVVADEPQDQLGRAAQPEMYDAEAQSDDSAMAVLVRSSLPEDAALAALRKVVREMDPQLALYDMQSMSDRVWKSVARERLAMWLAAIFAVSALVLAAVGIFGVAAHAVASRTREIGVRIAFGATRGGVLAMILRQELRAVAIGLAIGGVAAYAAARFVQSLLFNVSASDVWSFSAGAALLTITAFTACLIPARRAVRLNPVEALRND